MVAYPVGDFAGEVEPGECPVGAPDGMVVAAVDVRAECVFGGVPSGSVPAVMSERYGAGECGVEVEPSGDRDRDLGDFYGVGEPVPECFVAGRDMDLAFAAEFSERGDCV